MQYINIALAHHFFFLNFSSKQQILSPTHRWQSIKKKCAAFSCFISLSGVQFYESQKNYFHSNICKKCFFCVAKFLRRSHVNSGSYVTEYIVHSKRNNKANQEYLLDIFHLHTKGNWEQQNQTYHSKLSRTLQNMGNTSTKLFESRNENENQIRF